MLYHQCADNRPTGQMESADELPDVSGLTEKSANAASTYEEAEETAWTEIKQYIQAMNPLRPAKTGGGTPSAVWLLHLAGGAIRPGRWH